jgi:hypothetical protein
MSNICKSCKSAYSTSFNLNKHLKKCTGKKKYKCKGCKKEYSFEKCYLEHEKNCKDIKFEQVVKSNENIIEKLETIQEEIKNMKENKTINITNNIQANFIIKGNALYPLDLSQSRFDRIVDNNYTYKVYERNSVVRDVIIPYLSTDDGTPSAVITDKSRMTIKCIDTNNKLVTHDPKTIIGMCVSSKPLEEKNSMYEEKYTKDIYGDPISIFVEDASYKKSITNKHHIMKKHLYNYSNKLLQKKPTPIEANIKFIEE